MRADVIALPHALRRVVALPEELQQALEGDRGRVIDDAHDFGVARAAAADVLIGRIARRPAGVADGGHIDPVAGLPEFALRAPEAAHAEEDLLGPDWKRRIERVAVDEMTRAVIDGRGAVGKRPEHPGEVEFVEESHALKIRQGSAAPIAIGFAFVTENDEQRAQRAERKADRQGHQRRHGHVQGRFRGHFRHERIV